MSTRSSFRSLRRTSKCVIRWSRGHLSGSGWPCSRLELILSDLQTIAETVYGRSSSIRSSRPAGTPRAPPAAAVVAGGSAVVLRPTSTRTLFSRSFPRARNGRRRRTLAAGLPPRGSAKATRNRLGDVKRGAAPHPGQMMTAATPCEFSTATPPETETTMSARTPPQAATGRRRWSWPGGSPCCPLAE